MKAGFFQGPFAGLACRARAASGTPSVCGNGYSSSLKAVGFPNTEKTAGAPAVSVISGHDGIGIVLI